jgi:hypothetical protein
VSRDDKRRHVCLFRITMPPGRACASLVEQIALVGARSNSGPAVLTAWYVYKATDSAFANSFDLGMHPWAVCPKPCVCGQSNCAISRGTISTASRGGFGGNWASRRILLASIRGVQRSCDSNERGGAANARFQLKCGEVLFWEFVSR